MNRIKEKVPSACVLYSTEHGRDDGLPLLPVEIAVNFMSNEKTKNEAVEVAAPMFICQSQMTEFETKVQQRSYLWRQHRVGKLTASNFHHVYTKTESVMKNISKSSKSKPQNSPIAFNILNESEDLSHLPQIKWGTTHENDGVKTFMSDVSSQHDGGLESFQKCGF